MDGGPPQGLVTLAKAQSLLADEITLLPCTSSGGKPVIEPGDYGNLRVLPPPGHTSLKFPNSAVKHATAKAVEKSDVVHIHGSWRYHLVAASKAARRFGIPYIIRLAGDLGRIPRRSKFYLKWPYFKFIEKSIFQNADAIHCCTYKELREFEELGLGTRNFVVPQPVDDRLRLCESSGDSLSRICPGLGQDDIALVYLGRIGWIKRLPLLADAFIRISKEFKRSHLIIAGPWEEPGIVDEIKAKVNAAGLNGRVHLPGMVKGPAKSALLSRATLFIQPSNHESFGISTAEAMLFGKTCIVASGVALSDDIGKAGAGLVFEDGTESLAEAIIKLLSDEILRKRCGQNALKLVESFKPDVVARTLKKHYNYCISEYSANNK